MKKYFLISLLLVSIPSAVSAAQLNLEASKARPRVGQHVEVILSLSATESINALSGELIYDTNTLSIEKISDGASVVNFWVEKPYEGSPGNIVFSGITPGGIVGQGQRLFSVQFLVLQDGVSSVGILNATTLKNDGQATNEPLTTKGLTFHIEKGTAQTIHYTESDAEAPEDFNPIVSKMLRENGEFVLIFSTQDKDSGIKEYRVKEYKWRFLRKFKRSQVVTSPYSLNDKKRESWIEVQAIDFAGNKRVKTIPPQAKEESKERSIIISIVLVASIAILTTTYAKRRKKKVL